MEIYDDFVNTPASAVAAACHVAQDLVIFQTISYS